MEDSIFALIPILGISCGLFAIIGKTIFKPFFEIKRRQIEIGTSMAAEKAAQYAAQTERLEQRVRVLERIVTDRGHDLAGEIENLRDAPASGQAPALTKMEH